MELIRGDKYILSAEVRIKNIDLSNYSDDEIIVLLGQIQNEVVSRKIEKTAVLPSGTYIGGDDIPTGKYVLTNADVEGKSGIVSLRSVNDPENEWPSKLYEFNNAEEDFSVFITVEDGDTLILPYTFELTISGGMMFK